MLIFRLNILQQAYQMKHHMKLVPVFMSFVEYLKKIKLNKIKQVLKDHDDFLVLFLDIQLLEFSEGFFEICPLSTEKFNKRLIYIKYKFIYFIF